MSATGGLRGLSGNELEQRYAEAGDDTEVAAVLAELVRRERRAAQSASDRAWWARVSAEWYDFTHAQYLAADAQCKGNLFSREGLAAGPAYPVGLWSGPASTAMRYASEELRGFWDTRPRVTLSQYAWHAARTGRGREEAA
jgi:hypothetical protein